MSQKSLAPFLLQAGVLSVERRPRPGQKDDTNVVRIIENARCSMPPPPTAFSPQVVIEYGRRVGTYTPSAAPAGPPSA